MKVKDILQKKARVNVNLNGDHSYMPDFINVGTGKNVDIQQELEEYPWDIPSDSVDLLIASHIIEHINPHKYGFINFMNEAWRVLKPNGQFMVSTPYAGSAGFYQDPLNINPCNEATWYYFDPMQVVNGQSLYSHYEPAPWKVENVAWADDGNMETLLIKRLDDISYHANGKVKYGKKNKT